MGRIDAWDELSLLGIWDELQLLIMETNCNLFKMGRIVAFWNLGRIVAFWNLGRIVGFWNSGRIVARDELSRGTNCCCTTSKKLVDSDNLSSTDFHAKNYKTRFEVLLNLMMLVFRVFKLLSFRFYGDEQFMCQMHIGFVFFNYIFNTASARDIVADVMLRL